MQFSFVIFWENFCFLTSFLIKIRHIKGNNRFVTQKAEECCCTFDFKWNSIIFRNSWLQIHIEKLWNVDLHSSKILFFEGKCLSELCFCSEEKQKIRSIQSQLIFVVFGFWAQVLVVHWRQVKKEEWNYYKKNNCGFKMDEYKIEKVNRIRNDQACTEQVLVMPKTIEFGSNSKSQDVSKALQIYKPSKLLRGKSHRL